MLYLPHPPGQPIWDHKVPHPPPSPPPSHCPHMRYLLGVVVAHIDIGSIPTPFYFHLWGEDVFPLVYGPCGGGPVLWVSVLRD